MQIQIRYDRGRRTQPVKNFEEYQKCIIEKLDPGGMMRDTALTHGQLC